MDETIRRRNLALVYDSETSGLPLFEQPSEDPRQPHIVQLGAILVDLDSREELEVLDVIVRPVVDGPEAWTIPDEVAAIHGITMERALAEGIPEAEAVERLMTLWGAEKLSEGGPRLLIAHNENFDRRIVRIGLKRYFGEEAAEDWKRAQAHCTAKITTPILKLPPTDRMRAARRFHHKTPNLTEAYQHFFGQAFDGAHSALADCRACLAVYGAVLDLQRETPVAA
jgi:DNA polymerase-3 subunit epsilon